MNGRGTRTTRTATLGAALLLACACSPTDGGAARTSASPAAVTAQTLCDALLTARDVPAGFRSRATGSPCDFEDPGTRDVLQSVAFDGREDTEEINEELELLGTEADAVSRYPSWVANLSEHGHRVYEQNAAPFRDLGDDVRHFLVHDTAHGADVYFNQLYVRRGRLLVFLNVTSLGAFPPADLHRLASKALDRTAALR
ncbi:hypothetical protein AB0442_34295 [Kitasatospora sp. NPDC085895]|uniref:hypothetical protein n=1 Tax=Kitasatospora sp. NPDC085895 TaxID=3155057 RepID=UPI00344D1091